MKASFPMISIIIDNWDGKHFLNECLPTVFKQNYPNYEVIVIDDNSKDGSAKFVKINFPKVILIENYNHVGFAIANNQGIEKSHGKYVLLLNNDTLVTPNFLFPLVELLEKNDEIGAVQPKIRLIPEKKLLDNVASYLTPFGFLYHKGFFEKDRRQFDKRMLTFSPKGACFLANSDLVKNIGLFDERYYCYFEESDLAWRIWLSGKKIVFEPKSIIYHHQGGTFKKQTRPNIDFLSFKNRLNSLCTNLSFFTLMFILPLHFIAIFFFIIYYIFSFKWENARAIIKAILWNTWEIRSTIKKRKFVQKEIRQISDIKLFSKTMKLPNFQYCIKHFVAYQKGR